MSTPSPDYRHMVQATSDYESWLGRHLKLIPADVKTKHEAMREGLFPFFRATFYRWAQLWPDVCKELCPAPEALSVGDLHVENFGTWRDAEGRLGQDRVADEGRENARARRRFPRQ